MKPGISPLARGAFAYRAEFPARWRDFLRAVFPSARKTAAFFAVDERTARSWWHGSFGPQGYAVALAMAHFPEEARRYLLGALERWVRKLRGRRGAGVASC